MSVDLLLQVQMLQYVMSEHVQPVHTFLLQLPDEMSQGASTLKVPQRAYFQTLASSSVKTEPCCDSAQLHCTYLFIHLLHHICLLVLAGCVKNIQSACCVSFDSLAQKSTY